ncbi:Npun_F0296 family exosortase-dependent surface protein [Marinobacter zhejiangensis]|uniref:PEP-CTERM protein-sorting domain-containing protein n=1 Tax=Marinobacter zhejiangensis TaxID=488535 RepID=A0A1I4M8J7_9GAMM|nr:PEP-CTERM sorting domain-containing protein [Marinobacter zhejiangensis]SFL99405.1 PEP-CTERM protein-sorting domain-containing protein [Marinobacter zhejiangensis]
MKRFSQWMTALSLTLAFTGAQATVITHSDPGEMHTDIAGATEIDFGNGCGYASCSGDFQIVTGDLSGRYAAPAGTESDNPYLSVPNPVSSGTAVLELGETANYFGLYWGSIDSYNTISFFLAGVLVDTFTGNDVSVAADGNQLASATNRFINFFFGDLRFDEVQLGSDGYAFESDNHAYATVSEPGTLALLGIALAGLVMARRRKQH